MGRSEQSTSRRVRIVGGEGPSTRAVEEGVAAFEAETVSSVATLTPASVAAVVVVAPTLDVSPATAVERIRRVHGETPVVVAADEVQATRADAFVPIDSAEVERVIERIFDDEAVARTQRSIRRLGTLLSEVDDGIDLEDLCERLTERFGYDTAWVVRRENDAAVPIEAAGVPLSALRTVDVGDDTPWTRALRSGESVLEAGEAYTVAVPFDDHCLVCTTDAPVGDGELATLERVVASLSPFGDGDQPRYALLGEAVTHEVNNQLDIAMVHLDLLDDDSEHFDNVVAALERIGDVIDEVNALVSSGLSTEEVSLATVSEEVWEGVSANGASLKVEGGTVEADDRLLRLLLSNLFRNAVQHAGEDVTVVVGPLEEEEGFYVEDDGVGFTETSAEQLFEWGWSGGGGTGIGLALVALAADRHGWDVECNGNGGARFEFRP